MSKLKMMVLGGSLLLTANTLQAAEVSGNVSIGTDYIYRGISQTTENPTIQGGFDVEAENGFYAGIWGSNVDFDGSVEIDLYAGYGGSFTDEVSYDIGLLRYEYPDDAQGGAPDSSFNEVYGSISVGGFTVGLNYSPDFFFESDTATYFYADYELSLPNDFGLAFHIGDQSIDDNAQFTFDDYNEYSVSLSKTMADLDFSLTWHDTDLDDCDICDSRVVLAIGKSL
ncbi:MAG: TorF family putative porin [Pseudomonadales bacterium]|nr:TorF family putative porin [Pseudomonadales bacterium]